MKVAIAQIAPALLDRDATLARVLDAVARAGAAGCSLLAFGEAFVPGYPIWLCRTDGARFEDPAQKALHQTYLEQAVAPHEGHLDSVVAASARHGVTVVLGIVERPADRAGHSLYCSRVVIDPKLGIVSIHRKLMPTYEERLCWGIGDGHGLTTHPVGPFTMGALNCWENWMPLARAALHAQGENLHVALWPGRDTNTREITRFLALESRSFVISAGALLHESDVPKDFPMRDTLLNSPGQPIAYNGGSCIAGPDGRWIVEPVRDTAGLIFAELDHGLVLRERQSLDISGHYSRPDVLRLIVDRARQTSAEFTDSPANRSPANLGSKDRP